MSAATVKRLLASAILPCSANALAAAEALPSATDSVAQMLLGLGIVLIALFACLALLRRLQSNRGSAAGALKVLSATPVGPRERVVLISVGKQVLVLGVAPGRVSALHAINEEDLPAAPAATAKSDFANRLRGMMERSRDR